jgi:hypothetical protein
MAMASHVASLSNWSVKIGAAYRLGDSKSTDDGEIQPEPAMEK